MPKTKTKSKKPAFDDDEDGLPPVLPLPLDPVVPARRTDTGLILDMEGNGSEVASALLVNGLRAYLSVVNKGISLVASNRAHTLFVPVKVAACVAGLDIKRDDAKPLVEANGVVAFLLDDDEGRASYYIPVAEYLARAADRGESGLRLDLDKHAEWLEQYEGHPGIRRVFERLLS